ncbi:DUF5753 domain-containing protein [Streptomyces sp. NPDC052020]|uniref:DUF5753 domain-containing protein n=1 Tax=Streptomyces sp. NPDC052020 TaxID=3155677 RepID=UPI00343887E2
MAKHSKKRGWWLEHAEHLRPDYLDHIALEDDATYIRQWQPVLVPGLLQTPAYARAVITGGPDYIAPEVVAQLVNVREGRQTKIQEGGTPYTAILGEMVVAQPLVSGDIHREQLAAILEVAQRKNVTVQVLGSESKLKEEKPAVVAAKVPALNGTSGSSERQGHRKGARRMIRRAPLRRRAAMSYSFSIT